MTDNEFQAFVDSIRAVPYRAYYAGGGAAVMGHTVDFLLDERVSLGRWMNLARRAGSDRDILIPEQDRTGNGNLLFVTNYSKGLTLTDKGICDNHLWTVRHLTADDWEALEQKLADEARACILRDYGSHVMRTGASTPYAEAVIAAMRNARPAVTKSDRWGGVPNGYCRLSLSPDLSEMYGAKRADPSESMLFIAPILEEALIAIAQDSRNYAYLDDRPRPTNIELTLKPVHDAPDEICLAMSGPGIRQTTTVSSMPHAGTIDEVLRQLIDQYQRSRPRTSLSDITDAGEDPPAPELTPLQKEVQLLKVDGSQILLPSDCHLEQYAAIKKLMEAAGGKYQRGRFKFPSEAYAQAAMDAAMGGANLRKETQFFATSPEEAKKMLHDLDGDFQGGRMLEPSAGRGAIADEAHALGFSEIVLVESHPPHAQHLRSRNRSNELVIEKDFLSLTPKDIAPVDVVLMNPPFTAGAAIKHVSHALSFLHPTGQLSAIMPTNAGQGRGAAEARFGKILEILGNPVTHLSKDAFKHAGTGVSTKRVKIHMPDLLQALADNNLSDADVGLDLGDTWTLFQKEQELGSEPEAVKP